MTNATLVKRATRHGHDVVRCQTLRLVDDQYSIHVQSAGFSPHAPRVGATTRSLKAALYEARPVLAMASASFFSNSAFRSANSP